MKYPVGLFVYNRPKHTYNTLLSLSKNDNSKKIDLYIFCDFCKKRDAIEMENVYKVKRIIHDQKWKICFKTVNIIEREKNFGLFNNVVQGATYIFSKYNAAIFLEDDLETSKNFYNYMCEALEQYETDNRIWGISGFTPNFKHISDTDDLFLIKRANSWGWATWKKNWETINWSCKQLSLNSSICKMLNDAGKDLKYLVLQLNNEKIDSWATIWCYYSVIYNKFTIYFKNTLVKNIGLDNSGTHSRKGKATDKFVVEIEDNKSLKKNMDKVQFDSKINDLFNANFKVSLYSEIKWFFNIYHWR